MMRISVVPVLAGLVLAGCGSSESPAATTSDASAEGDPFKTNGATKNYGDKATACAKLVAAYDAKAKALGCTLSPAPSCPAFLDDFEAKNAAGKCIDGYDLGTIDNCEKRIATYSTCADFGSKGCEISMREAPVGTKCAKPDAGAVDSGGGTDAGGTDAGGTADASSGD